MKQNPNVYSKYYGIKNPPFDILCSGKETFTLQNSIVSIFLSSLRHESDFLPAFQFENRDGAASGLSKFVFGFPPRRHHFSS